MVEIINIPLNKYKIDFNKYEKVVEITDGKENKKNAQYFHLRTEFVPITPNKVDVKVYNGRKLTEKAVLTHGEAWNLIGEDIWNTEVGNVIGNVSILATKNDYALSGRYNKLRGIKTATWGKKSHRSETVYAIKNNVRKMF